MQQTNQQGTTRRDVILLNHKTMESQYSQPTTAQIMEMSEHLRKSYIMVLGLKYTSRRMIVYTMDEDEYKEKKRLTEELDMLSNKYGIPFECSVLPAVPLSNSPPLQLL